MVFCLRRPQQTAARACVSSASRLPSAPRNPGCHLHPTLAASERGPGGELGRGAGPGTTPRAVWTPGTSAVCRPAGRTRPHGGLRRPHGDVVPGRALGPRGVGRSGRGARSGRRRPGERRGTRGARMSALGRTAPAPPAGQGPGVDLRRGPPGTAASRDRGPEDATGHGAEVEAEMLIFSSRRLSPPPPGTASSQGDSRSSDTRIVQLSFITKGRVLPKGPHGSGLVFGRNGEGPLLFQHADLGLFFWKVRGVHLSLR